MNFYFVYDEYTDVADKSVAAYLAHTVIDALKNPHERLSGEHVLGQMIRQ